MGPVNGKKDPLTRREEGSAERPKKRGRPKKQSEVRKESHGNHRIGPSEEGSSAYIKRKKNREGGVYHPKFCGAVVSRPF